MPSAAPVLREPTPRTHRFGPRGSGPSRAVGVRSTAKVCPRSPASGWACKHLRWRSRRTTGTGSGLLKAPGGRGPLPVGAAHTATKLAADPPASRLGVGPPPMRTCETRRLFRRTARLQRRHRGRLRWYANCILAVASVEAEQKWKSGKSRPGKLLNNENQRCLRAESRHKCLDKPVSLFNHPSE